MKRPSPADGAAISKRIRPLVTLALLLLAGQAFAGIAFVAASSTPAPSSSPQSSVTVDRPSGLVAGDVLLAMIGRRGSGSPSATTLPSGWTLVLSQSNASNLGIAIYRKFATSSEPASYTWSYGVSERMVGSISAYRGVDATTPIIASAARTNASSRNLLAPSITPGVSGAWIVGFFAADSGNVRIDPPSSPAMTERFGALSGTSAGPNGTSIESADAVSTSAGASGTLTATTASNVLSVTALVALKPSVASLGVAAIRLSYAVDGIYCLAHDVLATPLDSLGNVVSGYAAPVLLTTSSGRGSWSLVSGYGVLNDGTADDGTATYAWDANDVTVTFSLSYRAGASPVTVNATDGTVQDAGSQGSIAFTAEGFTVTSSPLASPHPSSIPAFASPQTAGTNVPIYLTAYGQQPTDPTCGVITNYTGAKSLRFWSTYGNPATGTVAPTIDGTTVATTEGTTTAQSVTFASGKASVTMKYKDAGSISVGMKDTTTGSPLLPNGIRGTTGSFVVRPSTLVVSAVTTVANVANPAATTTTGAGFVAAGAPFRAQVQARDAEGSVTPNFGLETPAEGVRVAATLVLPAAGRNGTANDGAIGNATAFTRSAAGTFTATTLYWDEVGIIKLLPSVADGNYLGSGALTGTLSGNVGRIYPASINLLAGSTVTPGCGLSTYMEQPALGTAFTLEARNAQGTRTQNYDLGLLGSTAVGGVSLVAENANSGVDLAPRITGFSGAWAAGQVHVSITNLLFARDSSVDGPFDHLRLGVTLTSPLDGLVIDSADLNASSSAACGVSSPCTAALLGSAESGMFYGRMLLRPGLAAENQPLDLSLLVQYWDGAAFRTLVADSCTTYTSNQATLSDFSGNLASGDTSIIAPVSATALISGVSLRTAPLRLSAPGMGHEGSARVTLAVPVWLQFPWNGAVLANPFAIAIFGHYRGHDRILYRHEVF